AVCMANVPEFILITHALTRLGAVLVPLNTRLTPPELAWQLADVSAQWLLYHPQFEATVTAVSQRAPNLVCISTPELAAVAAPDHPLRSTIDLSAVHTIIYTSGTTGRPKGAMLTYGAHWWSALGSALNLGHHIDDRWLAVLPLFHVGGLS